MAVSSSPEESVHSAPWWSPHSPPARFFPHCWPRPSPSRCRWTRCRSSSGHLRFESKPILEKHHEKIMGKWGKNMIFGKPWENDDFIEYYNGMLPLENSLHTTLASRSSGHLENHAGALRISLSNTDMLFFFSPWKLEQIRMQGMMRVFSWVS